MKVHITRVSRTCFYHLCRLRSIRGCLGREVTAQLVSTYIISRLDYCNSILANLPASTLAPLQRVLNAAARLVMNLGPRDHVTQALYELHWLPIPSRIQFKLSPRPPCDRWSVASLHLGAGEPCGSQSGSCITPLG